MIRSSVVLAFFVSLNAVSDTVFAQECDANCAAGGHAHCSHFDDRGLLDTVDEVAGRIHSGVSWITRGLRAELSAKVSRLTACRCQHARIGCDGPDWYGGSTCDSCGGVITDDVAISHSDRPFIDSDIATTIPKPMTSPQVTPGLRPAPSIVQPTPPPQAVPNSTNGPGKSPYSVPTYPPTRDSQVNPFEDEPGSGTPRSGRRPIPGRTIQYQRPSQPQYQQVPTRLPQPYHQRYDSQAFTTPAKTQGGNPSSNYWAGTEFDPNFKPNRIIAASNQTAMAPVGTTRPKNSFGKNLDMLELTDSTQTPTTSHTTPPAPLPPTGRSVHRLEPTTRPVVTQSTYQNTLR